MIRHQNQKQRSLEGFDTPPGMILDARNRWVRLIDCMPWDELADSYYKTLSRTSDEETVEQIRENPYLQYLARQQNLWATSGSGGAPSA